MYLSFTHYYIWFKIRNCNEVNNEKVFKKPVEELNYCQS